MEKFSERLKDLRVEKGVSQDDIAKATGLSRSIIGYWEKGKRSPSAESVVLLAKYFEVSADFLLGLKDD